MQAGGDSYRRSDRPAGGVAGLRYRPGHKVTLCCKGCEDFELCHLSHAGFPDPHYFAWQNTC